MGRYVIRRLLQAILLLFLLSLGMVLFLHLLLGGPVGVLFNPRQSGAVKAAITKAFGLDQPLIVQYFKWLGSALVGNFGYSFADYQPVLQLIGQRFPATLELFTYALSFALILAITLGVISAVRQGSITDYSLTSLSYFGISMPIFLSGLFAQYIFGVWLHWLPTSGTQ